MLPQLFCETQPETERLGGSSENGAASCVLRRDKLDGRTLDLIQLLRCTPFGVNPVA